MQTTDDWMDDSWSSFRKQVKERWPEIDERKLPSEPQSIDQLVGLIREQYGLPLDIATRQVVDLIESFRP